MRATLGGGLRRLLFVEQQQPVVVVGRVLRTSVKLVAQHNAEPPPIAYGCPFATVGTKRRPHYQRALCTSAAHQRVRRFLQRTTLSAEISHFCAECASDGAQGIGI